MRRLLPFLVILLVGCSGAGSGATDEATASGAPSAVGAADSGGPAATGAPGSEPTTAPSEASGGGGALPAACAEGLAKYLVAIEPLVSGFDPASATLGDLVFTLDEAVRSKSMELLTANDSRAPYSCSEVGLEWAYFDSDTPWDAVLAVAGDAAPGTVAYLTALQAKAALDVNPLSTYGIEGCDAAVESIKQSVADQMSAGKSEVIEMGIDDGMALLGLYHAYMRDVQNEVCPRDALGNDEFDFIGAAG